MHAYFDMNINTIPYERKVMKFCLDIMQFSYNELSFVDPGGSLYTCFTVPISDLYCEGRQLKSLDCDWMCTSGIHQMLVFHFLRWKHIHWLPHFQKIDHYPVQMNFTMSMLYKIIVISHKEVVYLLYVQ